MCATPDLIAEAVQDGSWTYFASATGNDTYVITPTPAIDAYATGQMFTINPDTANTGACTLNVNAKGAKDIKKLVNGAKAAMETGDIVATVPFTVIYDGTDMVVTSMVGGLMSGANSDTLTAGSDASTLHYHALDSANQMMETGDREFYPATAFEGIAEGTLYEPGWCLYGTTGAAADQYFWAGMGIVSGGGVGFTASVHDQNPVFSVRVKYTSATAQDGFIGFDGGNSNPEDAALTGDHFGFIIQDGTLYGSCADGATQSKTSAITCTVSDWNTYKATFDGTTVTFYLNDTSVGTLNTNVPNSSLTAFTANVRADATNADKAMYISKQGGVEFDRVN